jgi:uncharacterized protein (TIGR02147 family)
MSFKKFPQDAAEYLKLELELRMQGRKSYSLRNFAKDLEMSPGTLVDFLKGRLGFSRARAEYVSHEIGLNPEQRQHFWDLLEGKFSRNDAAKAVAKQRAQVRIDSEKPSAHAEITAQWYHMAILELIDLDEKFANPVQLAKVLGITIVEAKSALQRLFQVGMIRNHNGLPAVNENMSIVKEDLPAQALRQVQTQVLNLAQTAVESQNPSTRENFAAFVSIDINDLPKIRQDLRQAFFKTLQPYLAKEKRTGVYCFSMQLFKIFAQEDESDYGMAEITSLQNSVL